MKEIDLKNWYRKDFYELYTNAYDMPLFHIFTSIDVTNVYTFAKKHNVSFYFSLGHIFHTAISSIEEFNIRIKDNKLVVDECNDVSFICLEKGERMFKIVDVPYQKNILKFCKHAAQRLAEQKTFLSQRQGSNILEYITCQPWLECQMTNPYNLNKDNFITRLSWDKIKTNEENGHKTVNVTFGANHRVIDGLLVATVFKKVEELIDNLV